MQIGRDCWQRKIEVFDLVTKNSELLREIAKLSGRYGGRNKKISSIL